MIPTTRRITAAVMPEPDHDGTRIRVVVQLSELPSPALITHIAESLPPFARDVEYGHLEAGGAAAAKIACATANDAPFVVRAFTLALERAQEEDARAAWTRQQATADANERRERELGEARQLLTRRP